MAPAVIVVIWRYEVKPAREDAFRELYGPDGEWARLFATDPAYLGTELLKDSGDGHTYLTLDRWRDRAAYEAFLARREAEYAALDAQGMALTASEERIGIFVALS